MNNISIDLYSDTLTQPSTEMRRFIYESEVGDEQKNEDPTVNLLIEKICDLLGKENAVFMPSGTMCNQIAFMAHCQPGDEVIVDSSAHTVNYEVGGMSALSGVVPKPLNGENGIFSLDQFKSAIRPDSRYFSKSKMVLIEQTSNLGGGSIWPLETINQICEEAHSNDIICHMDGARLLNAVVETNISAKDYSEKFDSVWIDFSKGLGAPVGAMLAGSNEFIEKAWRHKQQVGGAMRQSGIIAAGALFSLEYNIDRLKEDHINAKRFAQGLEKNEFIDVGEVQTNMVFFKIKNHSMTAMELTKLCLNKGLRFLLAGPNSIRAVTHMDVSESDIDQALNIINEIFTQKTN